MYVLLTLLILYIFAYSPHLIVFMLQASYVVRNGITATKSSRHDQSSKFYSLEKDNSKRTGKLFEVNAKLQIEQQKVLVLERERSSTAEKIVKAEIHITEHASFIGSL